MAEGTIVRCITRLDETCREVRDAARVIGDAELFKKMEEAQIKIKRDSTSFVSFCSLIVLLISVLCSCIRGKSVLLDILLSLYSFMHSTRRKSHNSSEKIIILMSPIYNVRNQYK